MWWVQCDGWYWLHDEGRDGPYDEYGNPIGSAFDIKRAVREAREATNIALSDGLPDPVARIYKDTSHGLVEVYKSGKRLGKARDGAKPL